MSADFEFDIFHGQLSPNGAQVYARVAALPGGGRWTLSGRMRGPECYLAKMLTTNIPFVDLGRGPTLLAKATLTDPCFWSAELPALYRVTIELRSEGSLIATHERPFGLRFLGHSERYFYWENKRWVLRGVHRDAVWDSPLSTWRETATAMVVEHPDDELCLESSRQGVVVVAKIGAGADVLAELRRLAAWPCVAIALIESPGEKLTAYHQVVPNLILGTLPKTSNDFIPEWSQTAFVDAPRLPAALQRLASRPIALIASRRLGEKKSLAEARAACDILQRDVVQLGDFAGYVV